jgi:hypothetical protein
MQKSAFRYYFKRLYGVCITDKIVLFRKPLQLYSLATDKVIADFKNLDEAFAFNFGDKTLAQIIEGWVHIPVMLKNGGRGSSSGMGFSGSWPSAGGGGGNGFSSKDLPARMNVKISGAVRSYDDMLRAFIQIHGNAGEEHGITIDSQGFTTQYIHGTSSAVAIGGRTGEIVVHNHPSGGWPNFSKEDLIATSMESSRGIVAVSTPAGRGADTAQYAGTYTFVKGQHFNSSAFVKGVNSAKLSGKDYNDAVSKWLKANQKKYGYSYSFVRAK